MDNELQSIISSALSIISLDWCTTLVIVDNALFVAVCVVHYPLSPTAKKDQNVKNTKSSRKDLQNAFNRLKKAFRRSENESTEDNSIISKKK